MRFGVIDIGSNTVKFLVAEREVGSALGARVVVEESYPTRLAEDLIHAAELKPIAMERTLEVLGQLRDKGEQLGVERWCAVATSAVRDAANRKVFLRAAGERLGFAVTLYTGEEEAETIFLASASDPRHAGRELFAVDVGGGSAEWIQGEGRRVARRVSLPLGAVRLKERFVTAYPLSTVALEKMLETVSEQVAEALRGFELGERRLVATGGTITVTAAVILEMPQFDAERLHGLDLNKEAIEGCWRRLAAMEEAVLATVTGMPAKRADILVPGLTVYLATLRILGAPKLQVSVRGLRYGVLQRMLGELE